MELKVTISNIEDTVAFLTTFGNNIGYLATRGTNEAGWMLYDEISKDPRVDDTYRRSLVVETDFGAMRTIVGPTIEYAPLKELGDRTRFVRYGCPWWRYLGVKLRKAVVSTPILGDVVAKNIERIKAIIVKNIVEGMR